MAQTMRKFPSTIHCALISRSTLWKNMSYYHILYNFFSIVEGGSAKNSFFNYFRTLKLNVGIINKFNGKISSRGDRGIVSQE